jgi:hypothetical protein
VVTYVAHKRGGAHYDETRKDDEEIYKFMDEARSLMRLGTLDVVFAETLAIIRHITSCSDIRRLEADMEKVVRGEARR